MLDKERRLEKEISFYQSLSDSLLENIINALHINNRDERRKIKKQKTVKIPKTGEIFFRFLRIKNFRFINSPTTDFGKPELRC